MKPESHEAPKARLQWTEVVNGFQAASDGGSIEILDLHTGLAETLRLDGAKASPLVAGVRAGWLLSHRWLGEALSRGLGGLDGDARVSVADLLAALEMAPERAKPPFPVPPVSRILRVGYPSPWDDPARDNVHHLVSAALALAWRGGRAYEVELDRDLAERLGGRSSAVAAMALALRRSDGNIRKEGHGNFAVWRMQREWKRLVADEGRVESRGIRGGGGLGRLFDDDSDGDG